MGCWFGLVSQGPSRAPETVEETPSAPSLSPASHTSLGPTNPEATSLRRLPRRFTCRLLPICSLCRGSLSPSCPRGKWPRPSRPSSGSPQETHTALSSSVSHRARPSQQRARPSRPQAAHPGLWTIAWGPCSPVPRLLSASPKAWHPGQTVAEESGPAGGQRAFHRGRRG